MAIEKSTRARPRTIHIPVSAETFARARELLEEHETWAGRSRSRGGNIARAEPVLDAFGELVAEAARDAWASRDYGRGWWPWWCRWCRPR